MPIAASETRPRRPQGRRGWPLVGGGIGSALLHAGAFAGVLIAFDGPPALTGGIVIAVEWAAPAAPADAGAGAAPVAVAEAEAERAPAPAPAPAGTLGPEEAAPEPEAASAPPPQRTRTRARPAGIPGGTPAVPVPPPARAAGDQDSGQPAAPEPGLAGTAGLASLSSDRDARPLYAPAPDYPPHARRRGIEGRVVVRIVIAADGRTEAASVLRSSGDEALDRAAVAAARRWRFAPAQRQGSAAPEELDVPFVFRLAGKP